MHAGSRLVDEFRAEVAARRVELSGELVIIDSFADFDSWPGGRRRHRWHHRARGTRSLVPGEGLIARWVVFGRVRGEIRYYAAALAGPREDPVRRAAIQAESDYSEGAILASVADAFTLTAEYLRGKPLREIDVPRLPPPWGFPDPEPG